MAKSHDPPTAPYDYAKTRTVVSDQQIAQSAYNAGFRGPALITAIAVAIGESHGNTTALNDRNEFSVGLWQINVHGYLKQRLQQLGLVSWTDLYNPDNNAKAAYKISNGGKKFGAWSVYKHNGHLKYMDRATAAAATVNAPTPAVGGTTTITQPHDAGVPVTHGNLGIAPVSIHSTGLLEIMIAVVGIVIVAVLIKTRSNANG